MFTKSMTYDDLPNTIPIFPLEGALLLPGGLLPLNIFEEKYIRMIDDALRTDRMIGMIQPDQNARSKGQDGAIVKTGCMGRIVQFSENENNKYMIVLQGMCRFKVGEEMKTILPYRQVKAAWEDFVDDMVEGCDHIEIDRDMFFPLLKKFMTCKDLQCDWDCVEQSNCETLLHILPMILPFDPMEQQALLEAKTLDDRFEKLCTLIRINLQNGGCDQSVRH